MSVGQGGFVESVAPQGVTTFIQGLGWTGWARLIAGSAVTATVFAYAARTFGIPAIAGFETALPIGSAAAMTHLLVLLVVVVLATLIGAIFAGNVFFDEALFCALAGMLAVSARCGRMGDLLRQNAPTQSLSLFPRLAIELAMLFAVVAVGWGSLFLLKHFGLVRSDEPPADLDNPPDEHPVLLKLGALLMQVGITALLIVIIAQTDERPQVLGAVFVASCVAAGIAHHLYPISPSPWFWVAPLFVGVGGYLLVYFRLNPADPAWQTGHLILPFGGLARPLPIDYATAGPLGALVGYWMGRLSERQQLADAAAAGPNPA